MNETDINQLADAWIAEQEADEGSKIDIETLSSADRVSDLHFDDDHETVWKFIQAAYSKNISRRVFAILAAGPLEDLLADFGPHYIDRIETLARQDPKFNDLLGGVWKNAMTNDVWERVVKARNTAW